MMDGDILPPAVLQRKAVVYVRQSTQAQVELNTEGVGRRSPPVKIGQRPVGIGQLGMSGQGEVLRCHER